MNSSLIITPYKIWVFNLNHEPINLKTDQFMFYDLSQLGQL